MSIKTNIYNKFIPIRENLDKVLTFAQIMPFLDNEKILSEIYKARELLKLNKLIPHKKYEEWFDYQTKAKSSAALTWRVYFQFCPSVLEKYGRQDIHYHTLWIAIVCGEITEEDCKTCYVEIIYPDLKPTLLPKLVVCFNPSTTIEELESVFKKEKGNYIKKYLNYEIAKRQPIKKLIKANVNLQALREERNLYLIRKQERLSYLEIAKKKKIIEKINPGRYNDKNETAREYVRSRIKSYEARVDNSLLLSSLN